MQPTRESIHVLHVDDEPDFVEMAATFLEREGENLTVETATSVSEGLKQLGSEDFDCIVSDYELTEQTGLEFLARVRDRYPQLPFILYTGKGSEEVASEAISMGVTDYLQKGAGRELYELLANRVENVVAQYRAQHRATQQERILHILREVNHALVAATTRDEIATALTDILGAADPYCLAWVGEYEADDDRIDLQAVSKSTGDTRQEVSLRDAPEGAIREAVRTNELIITTQSDPTLEIWDDEHAFPYEEAALAPLVYQNDCYGLLALYASEQDAFDTNECEMLTELAGDTAQALHTAETHRSLRRHQTAVEAVPEGVFILNENTVIELANERAAGLIGLPLDEVQDEHFPALVEEGIFEEEIIEWYLESVRRMLSSDTDQEEARYETEVQPTDGPSRRIEIHLALRPYEDEFRGTVGLIRDITDRKQRELQLRRQHAFTETALESVIDFYWILNPDGHVIDWSDEDGSVTGYTPRDAIGKHATAFFPAYERDDIADRIVELRETGETTAKADFLTKDGTIVKYRFDGTAITDDEGQVVQLCGFGRDISDGSPRERTLERHSERLE